MQVAAVVELAVPQVGREIRHVSRQFFWRNVVQSKFLKPGRVNDSAIVRRPWVQPIRRRICGGVFAAVERP